MTVESLTWVDAGGVEHPWPTVLLRGMSGRGAPPVEVVTRQVPQRAGAVRVAQRALERRVVVPLLLTGDPLTHRTLVRTWAAALDTTDGPGTLRFDLVDGSQREISASVANSVELEAEELATMTYEPVEFVAHDPAFCDTADSTAAAAGQTSTASWFPIFPLVLAASEISAELIIDNTGDYETWPVITITGPATAPTVRNVTANKLLALSGTVAAGQTVTLDSRTGRKTVTDAGGANLYGSLTSRQWWPLAKGQNRVRLEAVGTTSDTLLSVRWRRRWRTI